jgi:hypothetical protein
VVRTPAHTAPRSRAGKLLPWHSAAIALTALLLALRFFFVAWKYSVNLFFGDEWDYLNPFFRHQPRLAELFVYEFSPTRGGIGLIADRILFSLTRWNERSETFLVAACIFAAMLAALWLKRKLFGPLTIHDMAIPAMFLTLAQYETLIGIPHPSWRGFPLLMIMLYCLALLQQRTGPKYASLLLLNLLLIYTGYGVFMGVVSLGVFSLECYWSLRGENSIPFVFPFAAWLLAAVSLGSFFIGYSWATGATCFEPQKEKLWSYPWFIAIMFSRMLVRSRGLVFISAVGGLLFVAAIAILIKHLARLAHDGPATASLVGAALISYSLIFAAATAVGRACLGLPEAAQASRYVTLMIPAFLGIYFYLLSMRSAGRTYRWGLLVFVALLLSGAILKKTGDMRFFAEGKRSWAECYRQTESIHGCDEAAHFRIYPNPEQTGLQQKLDYLKERRLNLFADAGK